MIKKFREGKGDFIHLQAPQSIDLTYDQFDEEGKNIIRSKVGNIVEYIGKIIGPLSFSTLICKREYLDTKEYHKFIEIFQYFIKLDSYFKYPKSQIIYLFAFYCNKNSIKRRSV